MMKKLIIYALILVSPGLFGQSLDDTITIDEVVVTGSRIEISRKNMPVNVSVLHNDVIDEIEESAILPTVSRRIPGLFVNERGVTGFGRTGSESAGNISVRGVGGSPNAQVLVLVDGHPQYMGIFGHPLPNNYVASDLERVEVIRGPASILYGSNAMGGVLNFITKEQKKDGFTGSARAGYGSFNTAKFMTNAGYKKGKFNIFVSYNHDQTDGHRDSMDFNIDNGYVKAGYKINDHLELTADFNLADFTSLDPGTTFNEDEVNSFEANMVRGKTSISLKNTFDKVEGGMFAYYNFGDHNFSDGWKSNDENYGFSVYQGINLFSGNLITAGFDYKVFGGEGNIAFPPTYANQWLTVNEAAGYFIVRQSLFSKIMLSAGLRLENNSLFGNELVPQGGLSYHISDETTVKVSVSKGYRSPTISELYLFAPNPDLEPERMMNYEAGLSHVFADGLLSTEISLYMIEGENLILRQPNPNPPPPMTRLNTGSFSHKGFELEAYLKPAGNISADFTYSFLSMDEPKIAAPEHQLFTGLNYNIDKFRFALNANYIGGLYVATENTEGVNEEIRENYMLVNASLKYSPLTFMEVFFSVKNLLNTGYQIDYGYEMPGINFMTGVGIKF